MKEKYVYVIVGATFGGVVGYLLTDWLIYKYSVTPQALEKMEELTGDYSTQTIDTARALNDMGAISPEEMTEIIRKDQTRVDYAQHSKPDLAEVAQQITNEDAPYIITLEEFEEGIPGCENVDVKYYRDDGIYASAETDEEISAPQNLFGPNIQLHFGEDSDDPDIVYVCNPGRGVVYEIIQVYGSYAGMVKGEVKKTPPKKTPVKRKKRAAKKDAETSTD